MLDLSSLWEKKNKQTNKQKKKKKKKTLHIYITALPLLDDFNWAPVAKENFHPAFFIS